VPKPLLIGSGKGGTGKTTVALNLALALNKRQPTGFLDCDFTGPNAHLMLGLPEERLRDIGNLLQPPKVNDLEFMSVAIAFPKGIGLAWSHEKVVDMVRTLIRYVRWRCSWLVFDLPPSSIDVNVEILKTVGHRARGVVVGEPHPFAYEDNLRMLDLFRFYDVDVRCLVLNKHNLYPNAEEAAKEYENLEIPIVSIPFDPELSTGLKPERDYWDAILKEVLRS